MRPGVAFALRRLIEAVLPLLEAALALLDTEDPDELEEPESAAPDPVALKSPAYFGQESPTPQEPAS